MLIMRPRNADHEAPNADPEAPNADHGAAGAANIDFLIETIGKLLDSLMHSKVESVQMPDELIKNFIGEIKKFHSKNHRVENTESEIKMATMKRLEATMNNMVGELAIIRQLVLCAK